MNTPRAAQRVVSVTVTYHSDARAVEQLFSALRPQVSDCVIVDNGSPSSTVDALRALSARIGATLVALPENRGIAAAQNVGIDAARALGCTHVLLTDDDSVPAAEMVDRLVAGLERAAARGRRVAAVGPVSDDMRGGRSTLLFERTRWGPQRTSCDAQVDGLVEVAFLIASGCLIDIDALIEVGPMREALFIDHVDLEWCLRAGSMGYLVFGVCDATLHHELGDRVMRLKWLNGRTVHLHSPVRNYYLVRNTLLLFRGSLFTWAWKLGYVAWLAKFCVFNAMFVPPRTVRVKMLARGLWHGLIGRSGAYG